MMVGPSITDDDRRRVSRRLRVGFVVLVAMSGGLVAIQAGADLPGIAVASVAGGALGLSLIWYLVRIAPWDVADGDRGPGEE